MMNRPMMSEIEIQIIDEHLALYKPNRVLEWGSGGSTIYFPRKHPYIEKWVSIEHDGRYVNYIKRAVQSNVDLRHVKLEEYLNTVKDEKFNFILIDGLMRKECLMFAYDLIISPGIILLHDSGRHEFQKSIKEWPGKNEKLTNGEIEVKSYSHRGLHKFLK